MTIPQQQRVRQQGRLVDWAGKPALPDDDDCHHYDDDDCNYDDDFNYYDDDDSNYDYDDKGDDDDDNDHDGGPFGQCIAGWKSYSTPK